MPKHTKEIIARCKSDATVPSVSRNTGIPKSTIYAWLSVPKAAPELSPKEMGKRIHLPESKIVR